MAEPLKLSPQQQATLFHFLCHEEAFHEFTNLKVPGRIAALGPPFLQNSKFPDCEASPILEQCVRHFVLTETLPGFCKVKTDTKLWGEQVQGILERMAESTLSDSYDKGKVSKRKILGMAVSVFLSNIARGLLGRVASLEAARQATTAATPFDKEHVEAKPLMQAWDAWKREMIHQDHLASLLSLIREAKPCETWPQEHFPAALYVKLTIASLLHYIFVASPDGAETLSILSRLHEKLPYWAIRQGLKVPYATGMIQGLSKLFLAKSMFGSSNLLQGIISYILGGDQTRLEKAIAKLDKAGLNASYKSKLDEYTYETARDRQSALREESINTGKSIVATILGTTELPQEEHATLLKYLELQLARRDRVQLIQILTGDETLTNLVRTFLDTFFGIISDLHKAVDLPSGLADAQNFIGALIAAAESPTASLDDFIALTEKHEASFLKFGSQILRNSESLTTGYTRWYYHCLTAYRGEPVLNLESAIAEMDKTQQETIIAQLEAYQCYLDVKTQESERNLEAMLETRGQQQNQARKSADEIGFGAWLGILRDVQHDAKVTPKQPQGTFAQAWRPDMEATRKAMLAVFVRGLQMHVQQ